MSASFLLTLDTVTHVAASVNGGKGTTEKPTVTLELALDPDAALVKIWGDINPLDPMNAGMGTTEGAAEWIEASADFLVALTTNPGKKELHVRVQDDVGNEATATASITLSGEGPPLPPEPEPEPTHPAAIPATGLPEPRVEPERRELVTTSTAGSISSSSVIVATTASAATGPAPIGSSSSVAVARVHRSQISTGVQNSVSVRVIPLRQPLAIGESAAAVERRDGETFIASLIELGIL